MFGRRPATAARTALFDPDFACTVPGLPVVRVDYDPALWVRCPVVGEDRTAWVERVLSAHEEDLRWSADAPERRRLEVALNRIANDDLHYTANFAMFPGQGERPVIAFAHVTDEELTQLEFGAPESFLAFADVDPSARPTQRTFPSGMRFSSLLAPDGDAIVLNVRGHRVLVDQPRVDLTTVGFASKGKRSGDLMALFTKVSVPAG